MKILAVIQADLDVTPLGTRSRLATLLHDVPVLRRTIQRVLQTKSVSRVFVLCPPEQTEQTKALLADTPTIVRPFKADPPPWAPLVRAARKWSLDGWRGGLGGTTYFDEFTDPRLLHGLLQTEKGDAILSVPPAAVLFDPGLADRMADQLQRHDDGIKMAFTQAPPGLAGILLDAAILQELNETNTPIGWILSYKPDTPEKDLIFSPCCCEIPAEIRYATGRLVLDTDRSFNRAETLLREHPAPDLSTIGDWLQQTESATVEPLPREVEIELTTDDPYPDAQLRPRGHRVGSRGPIPLSTIDKVIDELVRFDDSLVILGGFGDPLRHPQFRDILAAIQSERDHGRRLFGLAVRTAGTDLTEANAEAITAHQVDILDVVLDAWTPELYQQLQSPSNPAAADLSAVTANLDRLATRCRTQNTIHPIVTAEMTKSRSNVHELDEFHDGWIRRSGAVTISGYSHHARQLPDLACMSMAPSPRQACRRLRSRCTILADGRVTLCDQDFKGLHTVGRIGEQSLEEIWQGPTLHALRVAHREAQFETSPLCAACDEWHRP